MHDAIIKAWIFQMHCANQSCWEEPNIATRDLVYLSTQNLNLPRGRAKKLGPKFVGPYKILLANTEKSTYMLELPIALQQWRIIPSFHVSLLRPYYASSNTMFPDRVQPDSYDFGTLDKQEWFIEEIIGHQRRNPKKLEFQVWWT